MSEASVDAPSAAPIRKVTAGGVGAAVTTIVIWVLSLFNITMPVVVAGALITVISFGVAYLVPSAPKEGGIS